MDLSFDYLWLAPMKSKVEGRSAVPVKILNKNIIGESASPLLKEVRGEGGIYIHTVHPMGNRVHIEVAIRTKRRAGEEFTTWSNYEVTVEEWLERANPFDDMQIHGGIPMN